MKPVPFDYYAPSNTEEALDYLSSVGEGVKVLAGGQSLIPTMNFRMGRPTALVDLNKIAELEYIRPMKDGGLAIGTMTRDSKVEDDPVVKEKFPLVVETVRHIGHRQIRNRGTFGGAMAHADPAAQLPALAIAMKARMLVRSRKGDRWVDAEDFFIGPFTTVVEHDELLAEVILPPMDRRSGWSYDQVSRQKGGYAQAGVITVVVLNRRGQCDEVRVVIFSVDEKPILSTYANETLKGKQPDEALISDVAATIASREVQPATDIHATEDYRRHVVEVLVKRSLGQAFNRAKK